MSENNNITNINTPKPIYEDCKYKCPNCNSELNNDNLLAEDVLTVIPILTLIIMRL